MLVNKLDHGEIRCEDERWVEVTQVVSSCGFGVGGVLPWGSTNTLLVSKIGCEDGRWIEVAQDRVQWRVLLLPVLKLWVLLAHRHLVR
jgi:hypothetical protein